MSARLGIVISVILVFSMASAYADEPKNEKWERGDDRFAFVGEDVGRRCFYFNLQPPSVPLMPAGEYNPNVYVGLPYASMIDKVSQADVLLIGELHDDAASHRMEESLANCLARRRLLFIAMEMFERDVQLVLDNKYGAQPQNFERLPDGEFVAKSRAWNNFVTDYRVFVEAGISSLGEVYASNAPTPISRRVAKEGLEAVLPTLSAEELSWIAESTTAPRDEYWQRFLAAMGGGASADAHSAGMSEEQIYRFYQAQCLKDDTMAETIARLREEDPCRQVVHLSGSFHIDYHLGIYPRLRQRRPEDKIFTVAIRPVADFAEETLQAALDAEPGVADYVVLVIREEPATEAVPDQ